MKRILPPPVRPGDTVRLICPSGALRHPDEDIALSVSNMEKLGFRVELGPGLTRKYGYFGGTDRERAREVNEAFADPACRAIVCVRGGYGTARILSMLDYEMIRAHPKRFLGYSDITALHAAISQKTGIVTFHSPMPMSGSFLKEYTREGVLSALCDPDPMWCLQNPAGDAPECVTPGRAYGRIAGGNLSLVASLIGTPWQVDWKGSLLFLEDVGEHTYRLDGMLTHLRNAGAFDECAGVCLGQFTDCTNEDDDFGFTIRQIVEDLIVPSGKPVVMNLRFGHTHPSMTFPVGMFAQMDASNGSICVKNAESH